MTTPVEPEAGQDRVNRLLVLGCFTAIVSLHLAALSAAGFPAKREAPAPETRELFLALQAAEREEPPAMQAAEPPPRVLPPEPVPAAPLPVTEEAVVASPVEAVEAAASVPALVEGGVSGAYTGDAVSQGPVNSVLPRRRIMTDAEYLALVMDRLEKNKIYPLSVRKRGIEGDITVDFTIRRDGTVSDVKADPSGHRFLVQAALETIRSAAPFPVVEGRGEYSPRVRIRYRLEDQ
jgi:TonB family protein